MSNIDKQALREAAERAKDNFIPCFRAPTRDVLALLDELEAKDKRNAELNSMLERWAADRARSASELDDAEKRIAELEARNASTNFPGGFSIEEARTLHTNLVNSHISKAMSGEKMNPAEKEQDLRWIHSVLVSAAWFVKASIEAAGTGKGE